MKIIRLQSENVKRLRVVDITPDPASHVVTIAGRNGAGKSSVLDSIAYALGGNREIPPEVIRRGEERAQVILETETLIITRKWTGNDKSTLAVKSKDGAKYPSPQKMLDELVGKLAFDPVAFLRLKPSEQAAALRDLVGLDFRAHDDRRLGIFDERADVNRSLNALRVLVEAAPAMDDVPDEPVSTSELVRVLEGMTNEISLNARRRSEVKNAEARLDSARQGVERVAQKLDDARRAVVAAETALAAAELTRESCSGALEEIRAEVAALADPDTTDVKHQLEQSGAVNERVRAKRALQAQRRELDETKKSADALSAKIAALDADKAGQLAAAAFPVPGLGFGAEGVTLNGLPLEQASSAERLRVSVAMGIAANPTMRVLLVRDGSLLDADSLSLVGQMAEEADAQVWLEAVSDGSGVGVVIEDGRVLDGAEGVV